MALNKIKNLIMNLDEYQRQPHVKKPKILTLYDQAKSHHHNKFDIYTRNYTKTVVIFKEKIRDRVPLTITRRRMQIRFQRQNQVRMNRGRIVLEENTQNSSVRISSRLARPVIDNSGNQYRNNTFYRHNRRASQMYQVSHPAHHSTLIKEKLMISWRFNENVSDLDYPIIKINITFSISKTAKETNFQVEKIYFLTKPTQSIDIHNEGWQANTRINGSHYTINSTNQLEVYAVSKFLMVKNKMSLNECNDIAQCMGVYPDLSHFDILSNSDKKTLFDGYIRENLQYSQRVSCMLFSTTCFPEEIIREIDCKTTSVPTLN